MIKKTMIAVLILLSTSLYSAELISSQTLYLPVYPSIFHGNKKHIYHLAVTISIRNTDTKNSIVLRYVDYYNTSGKLIRHYISGQKILGPLESINYIISESDNSGGPGANFIIRWDSPKKVNPPIVESVMIGTTGQQGISFTSRAIPIIR